MNPLLLRLAIAAGIYFAGFGSGYLVQGWKKDAHYSDKIAACTDKYHQLELSVERQNSGITLANYKLEVAEESRKVAEQSALVARNQLYNQSQKAKEITATTCNAMVESLKGVH